MKRTKRNTVAPRTIDGAIFGLYGRIRTECGYTPSYLFRMLTDVGGLATAKRLLHEPTVSDGFVRLVEGGHPELTIEALVIDPQWSPLFTPNELAIALQRLAGIPGFAIAA